MRVPPLYPLVSRSAGLVLFGAGFLKARDSFGATPGLTTPSTAAATAFELLFGVWLLLGLYPRWSRIAALACFVTLLHIALALAAEGRPSCGCFGEVSVRPWAAAALDGVMAAALVLCSPLRAPGVGTRATRFRWTAFGLSALVLGTVALWPVARSLRLSPVPAAVDPGPAPDGLPALVGQVLRGLDRNHAALPSLRYTAEQTVIEHPVKHQPSGPVRGGDGVSEPAPAERTSIHLKEIVIRGDEIRFDYRLLRSSDPGFPMSEGYMVGTKGKCIQYDRWAKQAGIQTAEFIDSNSTNALDLRCAGFYPPLKSAGNWLGACQVIDAGHCKDRTGREAVRIRVLANNRGNLTDDVTADFVPSLNYLPSRVVYRYTPTGGVSTVTDIDYGFVDSARAWFPRSLARRDFFRDTTSEPDALTGQNITTNTVVQSVEVGGPIRDTEFDPMIPPKTVIRGDFAAVHRSDDAPVRASAVTRDEPLRPTPPAPGGGSRGPWLLWGCADALLLVSCWVARKRLAF